MIKNINVKKVFPDKTAGREFLDAVQRSVRSHDYTLTRGRRLEETELWAKGSIYVKSNLVWIETAVLSQSMARSFPLSFVVHRLPTILANPQQTFLLFSNNATVHCLRGLYYYPQFLKECRYMSCRLTRHPVYLDRPN